MPKAKKSPKAKSAPLPSVLYLLHNPPQATGGTEVFARNLFAAIQKEGAKAFLLSATSRHYDRPNPGTAFIAVPEKNDELIYWGEAFDYFTQSSRSPLLLSHEFTRLLKDLSPEVVHVHHTLRFGVEVLKVVKDTLPGAKLVHTLHEYIPICHRDGMMVRTVNEELCGEASPKRCHECFPEHSEARFAMREDYIKSYFSHVDRFIAPSEFLKQRYVAWGLPAEKITVIKNGNLPATIQPERSKGSERNRFAYFGQISPYKGVLELIAAMRQVNSPDTMLDIHGGMGQQTQAFKDAFAEALHGARGNVVYHGLYAPEALPQLMEQTDWVVAPSVWWENAPMVVDEAFMHKRPVICSGIGGLAEKVNDGVNGLHVPPGDVEALAATLRRASGNVALWHTLCRGISEPRTISDCAREHVGLYGSL